MRRKNSKAPFVSMPIVQLANASDVMKGTSMDVDRETKNQSSMFFVCWLYMFHPICEYRPICRRAVGRWNGPIWLHFAQSADGTSADGTSHLPIFCPICRHFFQSADSPSADGTVPSGYILTTLPTFCPICILDKMSWDGSSRLPSEHNVGGWAVPSTDWPIWLHFTQSADGTSADGTSHLPTFCPICRHFVQSAYWTKSSHMGPPVCRRDKMLADGPSHLPMGTSADKMRRQMDMYLRLGAPSSKY